MPRGDDSGDLQEQFAVARNKRELFGSILDRAVQQEKAVHLIGGVHVLHDDAGRGQSLGVGDSLVAQGVELGGHHERGRETAQVGCAQREEIGVGPLLQRARLRLARGQVLLHEPFDVAAIERVALGAFTV